MSLPADVDVDRYIIQIGKIHEKRILNTIYAPVR